MSGRLAPSTTLPSILESGCILIIRRDNIGDLVCTTPLIRALRERFPKSRIDALVNSYNRSVLAGNPDLDQVFAYTKAKHRDSQETVAGVYWRRLRLLLGLRRRRYDLVILASGGYLARPLQLARWVSPRSILGFVPAGNAAAGIDLGVPIDHLPRHEVEDVFRLLQPLGIKGPPPPLRLLADSAAVERARGLLAREPWFQADRPTIAVHISARKVPQRWPAERFAELMRRLQAEQGCQFVLFWSPGDEDNPLHPGDDRKAAAILDACAGLPVLAYPTSRLEDLIGGLSLCSAAAGLGLPIVCFFGNSDAAKWHPWAVRHELLQKPSRDVNDISVDEAVAAFQRLRQAAP
jgi:heptosyltransferase-3